MKFSANLGFLFTDHPLPEAIHQAASAGFDAVECHFPFDIPSEDVSAALEETGLPMLGINARPGQIQLGEFGLAALRGRTAEAQDAIVEAVAYAQSNGAANIHVMAGKTDGGLAAETTFRDNLRFACEKAAGAGKTILIEPLNSKDVPGYHLSRISHAAEIITDLGQKNLKLMFDCYHAAIMETGLEDLIEQHLPIIGHVQIAAIPDRGEPDEGDLDYHTLLTHLKSLGYDQPIGAEYRPRSGNTSQGLDWLRKFQSL